MREIDAAMPPPLDNINYLIDFEAGFIIGDAEIADAELTSREAYFRYRD